MKKGNRWARTLHVMVEVVVRSRSEHGHSALALAGARPKRCEGRIRARIFDLVSVSVGSVRQQVLHFRSYCGEPKVKF